MTTTIEQIEPGQTLGMFASQEFIDQLRERGHEVKDPIPAGELLWVTVRFRKSESI